MSRLLTVCGLLTIALSMLKADYFEFVGNNTAYESVLREQEFSEEDIKLFLQEDRDAREEMDADEEKHVSWREAKGYKECEQFKWGKRKNNPCFKPKPRSDVCAEYDCPPIEKLSISGCGFEARRVLSAKWAVTSINVHTREGYEEAFWRLFKYVNRANDQGARITKNFYQISRWFLDNNYYFKIESADMAVYIPSAIQANPPIPTDDQVTVETWGDDITYNRAFGGESAGNRDKNQLFLLKKALAKENIASYHKMFITTGYLRPGCGRQRKEMMLVDNGNGSM